jgi:hypothetical protein
MHSILALIIGALQCNMMTCQILVTITPEVLQEMLRGLPLSKELGRWSGHSWSSSTSFSSTSSTSYGCTSSCSSGSSGTMTGFSACDLVWCICISAYARGALDEKAHNDYACIQGRWTWLALLGRVEVKFFYKVVNIIQEHVL